MLGTNALAFIAPPSVTKERKFVTSAPGHRRNSVLRLHHESHFLQRLNSCVTGKSTFRPFHSSVMSFRRPFKNTRLAKLRTNAINFFRRNCVAFGVTLVKIIGNYSASGVNCTIKHFMTVATDLMVINLARK